MCGDGSGGGEVGPCSQLASVSDAQVVIGWNPPQCIDNCGFVSSCTHARVSECQSEMFQFGREVGSSLVDVCQSLLPNL
jgi:hypothetical protein